MDLFRLLTLQDPLYIYIVYWNLKTHTLKREQYTRDSIVITVSAKEFTEWAESDRQWVYMTGYLF